MPKHTWSSSITTDAGSATTTDKIDIYGSGEQNIGGDSLATISKGLQIGIQDEVKVNRAVVALNIVSFFVKTSTAMRMRTYSGATLKQEFELTANRALAWNDENIPLPSSNPITQDFDSVRFFNHDTLTIGYVKASFLDDTDVVTS